MMIPFVSNYDSLRNEEEFTKFSEIFDKVLKRRGIERKKYRRDLEDYFCHVRISDQTRAKNQLKELFGKVRNLKKENTEIYEHSVTSSEDRQRVIDSLRKELHELKKTIEVESNEASAQTGPCNLNKAPSVLL